jgi:hypothetical protein
MHGVVKVNESKKSFEVTTHDERRSGPTATS